MMRSRLRPVVGLTLLLGMGLGADAFLLGQQKPAAPEPPKPAPQISPEQQDHGTLSQIVDAVAAGTQPPPTSIPLRWVANYLIKSQGDSVYIPFTVSVDRSQLSSPMAALYVRAVNREQPAPAAGAKPTPNWDTVQSVEVPADGLVSRAIALPPGNYDVFIAVKDRAAGPAAPAPTAAPAAPPVKAGLVRQDLAVPRFSDTMLTTSSIILARTLETLPSPLPAEKQQENPYVFGPLKVTPAFDRAFTNVSDLQVLFWIYGASHTGGKPDVQVDFNFHQKLADGEKYFNKTPPQAMNKDTLPPEFNLTAGHQLLSSIAIPLKSFPVGTYRLEIKITDKPTGMAVTRDAEFTVSAS